MFFPPQRLTRTKQCRRFALPARNEIMLVRPARMRGFPYSSSRRPRSPLPTNPVLLVSPRASQVSQQPYGSEPVHRLHLPALMRVTSLTPHQDDPVVRYPAITPTKYCTDSITIHQVPYQQHHIGLKLSLKKDFRHIVKVALKPIPDKSVHAREHHSSKTNLSNNPQHIVYFSMYNPSRLSFTLASNFE